MLGLPRTTEIKKIIAKNLIFSKFQMNTQAKDRFDADIKRITLTNEVSANTIAIAEGNQVSAFYAVHVAMKRKEYDERNIVLLSKLIPQNMLFILDYDGMAQLAVYRAKLLTSEWMPVEDLAVRLVGLDLDALWENIIVQVGQIEIADGRTLDEQIQADEDRAKLERRIAQLEKQAKREKQPSKRFELHQQILKLKEALNHGV